MPRRSASPTSTSRSTRCSPRQARLGERGRRRPLPAAACVRSSRRPDMVDSTPAGPRHLWRRLTYWYSELLSWLLAISLGILVIPVALQIFSRFTAIIPHYIWTEEMARFLFVWTIMIGAMIGVRESTHFEVDLWPRPSPRVE